ncbi:MAG TPA: hypothetical protein VKA46_20775 [Gemmataceae bacterium]|nr:hypothetical protein [Gemmataceae bacterium]
MAGRILNRRELRKQADEAEARESQETREGDDEDVEEADAEEDEDAVEGGAAAEEGDDEEVVKPAKKKAKAKAPPKPRKPRKPKAAPRMRARWGVFDASMKQVAIFDYNQRVEAEQKAADLVAKKNGTFFLQMVKEPMAEPADAGAVVPAAK